MTGHLAGEPFVRFVNGYWFPVSPAELWDTLGDFDRYPTWWVWLRELVVVPDDDGLVEGAELSGTVLPPVPFRLSLRVTLDRCLRPDLLEATVDGDLRGNAMLRLAPAGAGTTVTAAWTLQLVSAPLRVAARIASPLMRWGHDQVVAMAVAGFRHNALATPRP